MHTWFTVKRRIVEYSEAMLIRDCYQRYNVNYTARVRPCLGRWWLVEARKVTWA